MSASWDHPIREELRQVEEQIVRSVQSRQELLTEIAKHVVCSGGKRIRPGVALLSFRAVGGKELEKIVRLATAFELIHAATLIHDDINDGGEFRRGQPAAYRKYGTQRALVAGDFLFVKGFQLGGILEDQRVVDYVADACSRMAESEILQTTFEHETSTPLDVYLEIIDGKTARPIEASARVGAFVGGAEEELIDALGSYALNIGYAFQIADDILDITGREIELGKPRGMDFMDGKPTLPLLLAMNDPTIDGKRIRELFKKPKKTHEEVTEVVGLIAATDAVEESREQALGFMRTAIDALDIVPESRYKEALLVMAETVVNRQA
jgi:octaprenyl-diphosphate synthase